MARYFQSMGLRVTQVYQWKMKDYNQGRKSMKIWEFNPGLIMWFGASH